MPFNADERKDLVRNFSNRARKAATVGNRIVVPRLFDVEGNPLSGDETTKAPYTFNLKEAAFLMALRNSGGDIDKAIENAKADPAWARRFLQRKNSQAFLSEDEHYAALAEIASMPWVKGKIVAAVVGEETPTETQKWGLERLEKINTPRISAQVNIQNNTFQMPQLPPEQSEKVRQFFDTLADVQGEQHGQP